MIEILTFIVWASIWAMVGAMVMILCSCDAYNKGHTDGYAMAKKYADNACELCIEKQMDFINFIEQDNETR